MGGGGGSGMILGSLGLTMPLIEQLNHHYDADWVVQLLAIYYQTEISHTFANIENNIFTKFACVVYLLG